MSLKDTYGFTIDVESFVRICLSDPSTKEMVYSAIRKGTITHTTALGASNMKETPDAPDAWYTAFLATSNQIGAGEEGFVLRNSGGQGPRVSIRLKRQQVKAHTAQTPGKVLPPEDPTLLQRALAGDVEAAKALKALGQAADDTPITL
jgi:hypothetical protein